MAYVQTDWHKSQSLNGANIANNLEKMDNAIAELENGSAGKNWHVINITNQQLNDLIDGDKMVGSFDEPFDTTNFKNTYFECVLNTTGEKEGTIIYTGEDLTRVYFNVDGVSDDIAYIRNTLREAVINYGFDYHYYKTLVLFAGCDRGSYVVEGFNALDAKNVIYVQDVSQQAWEVNSEDTTTNEAVAIAAKREALETENYGLAYVISIQVPDPSATANVKQIGLLICCEDSQAAFWDGTQTKWVDIEAGKVYPVTFDTTHNTERWFVNVTGSASAGYTAVEITDAEKATLLAGYAFDADKVAADVLVDDTISAKSQCFGNGNTNLRSIFSFNNEFTPGVARYINFIGHPAGIFMETYTYTKGGTVITETEGQYTWYINVDNESLQVIVPKSDLSTYVVEAYFNSTYNNNTLYRHTFKITSDETQTWSQGEYKILAAMTAYNMQQGDTGVDYLLYSDMDDSQDYNWMSATSGMIGVVGASATTWYPIARIIAGWTTVGTDKVRTIFVDYIDTATPSGFTRASLITPENSYKYQVTDFRSEIGTIITPD